MITTSLEVRVAFNDEFYSSHFFPAVDKSFVHLFNVKGFFHAPVRENFPKRVILLTNANAQEVIVNRN